MYRTRILNPRKLSAEERSWKEFLFWERLRRKRVPGRLLRRFGKTVDARKAAVAYFLTAVEKGIADIDNDGGMVFAPVEDLSSRTGHTVEEILAFLAPMRCRP